MQKTITSINNSSVKALVQLQEKSRERRKTGIFIIEGIREIHLAVAQKYTIKELWYCPQILGDTDLNKLMDGIAEEGMVEVSPEVYKKVAYRGGTEGVIAFAKAKNHDLNELNLLQNPLLLIAEAPEKPGNIGAIIRTADAAGVDALFIADPKTDLYNPNIIRSSVGGVFTVPIGMATSAEIIRFLKENRIAIYAATLQDAKPYQDQDYKVSTAIVVGTEAQGLTQIWRDSSSQNIMIPMQGSIDSMNVSVAAGILIFEARRQRGFSKK